MKRLTISIALVLLVFTLSACDDSDYTLHQSEDIYYNIGDDTPDYATYFGISTNNKGARIDSFDDSLVDYTTVGEYELKVIIDVWDVYETEVVIVTVTDN